VAQAVGFDSAQSLGRDAPDGGAAGTTGAQSAPADLGLCLLSGFELRSGSEVVAVPHGSQRLVAFLALQSRPVQRAYVSGSLWPDANEQRAAGCLRSAMWRVPLLRGRSIVTSTATHMGLRPEVRVDYHETLAWATALVNGQHKDDLSLWHGPSGVSQELLPDWYDEWVLLERERFRQLRLHALEAVCERLVQEGRYAQALMAGLAAVAVEPLRESAHRLVVRAHIEEGNLYEAYRQYRSCAELLESELGLAPSPAMQALVAAFGGTKTARRVRAGRA
jgi:DNA-binding SARP family transcriptional activator